MGLQKLVNQDDKQEPNFRIKMDSKSLYQIMESAATMSHADGLMKFKEDKWDMKVVDGSNTALFAARVPESSMDVYNPYGVKQVGVQFEWFTDFLNKDSSPVELGSTNGKLSIGKGDTEAIHPPIDEENVSGKGQSPPNIDYAVSLKGSHHIITEFAKSAEKITNADNFFVSCREGGVYLYSEHDGSEYYEYHSWDDLNPISRDWEKGSTEKNTPYNPAEDKVVETIFDPELVQTIAPPNDKSVVYLDNSTPCRVVFELDSGIKLSWIVTPRIAPDGELDTIPERIIERAQRK